MDKLDSIRQALDLIPVKVEANERAVKEALFTDIANRLLVSVLNAVPDQAARDYLAQRVTPQDMVRLLAEALCAAQKQLEDCPPSPFVTIRRKYVRADSRSDTPNPNGRANTPEVSSVPSQATTTDGLFEVSNILQASKHKLDRLKKEDLIRLVCHHLGGTPDSHNNLKKAELVKKLLDFADDQQQSTSM